MTDKKRKPLKEYWRQATRNVKIYLENRTRRQRLAIIAVMLFVLLLGNIWIILRGVSGRHPLRIDRIERFEFPSTGSGNTNPTDEIGESTQESEESETDNN